MRFKYKKYPMMRSIYDFYKLNIDLAEACNTKYIYTKNGDKLKLKFYTIHSNLTITNYCFI